MKNIFLSDKVFTSSSLPEGFLTFLLQTKNRVNLFVNEPENDVSVIKSFCDSEGITFYKKTVENVSELSLNNNISFEEKSFDSFYVLTDFLLQDRIAEITRNTKETKIFIKVNLDGSGEAKINTGIGFFDHMLDQIARHANFDLEINVKGDLQVDEHHTVEDTGITLGECLLKAMGSKNGINRYGFFLPMDETITQCAIDLGGRTYLNFKCKFKREMLGEFPTELFEEFFRGLAGGMKANVYIKSKGKNDHHKIEAVFKAFARALNMGLQSDERNKGFIPTTKGIL